MICTGKIKEKVSEGQNHYKIVNPRRDVRKLTKLESHEGGLNEKKIGKTIKEIRRE